MFHCSCSNSLKWTQWGQHVAITLQTRQSLHSQTEALPQGWCTTLGWLIRIHNKTFQTPNENVLKHSSSPSTSTLRLGHQAGINYERTAAESDRIDTNKVRIRHGIFFLFISFTAFPIWMLVCPREEQKLNVKESWTLERITTLTAIMKIPPKSDTVHARVTRALWSSHQSTDRPTGNQLRVGGVMELAGVVPASHHLASLLSDLVGDVWSGREAEALLWDCADSSQPKHFSSHQSRHAGRETHSASLLLFLQSRCVTQLVFAWPWHPLTALLG